MSDTTDPEVLSLITNMCKPPINFDFPKADSHLGLFGLKRFHAFVILGGRIEHIACLVFYLVIKMWEDLYKKPYQNWQTAVKTFKETSKCFNGNTQKEENIVLKIFR